MEAQCLTVIRDTSEMALYRYATETLPFVEELAEGRRSLGLTTESNCELCAKAVSYDLRARNAAPPAVHSSLLWATEKEVISALRFVISSAREIMLFGDPREGTSAIDVSMFHTVRRLALVDCDVIAVRGVCRAEALELHRASLCSPPLVEAEEPLQSFAAFPNLVEFVSLEVSRKPQTMGGLEEWSQTLRRLALPRSQLRVATFFRRSTDVSPWRQLRELNLASNHLESTDPSWRLLVGLERLNLCDNCLSSAPPLHDATRLTHVTLSGNQLRSAKEIAHAFGAVTALDLRCNLLSSIEALAALRSLEVLKCDHNDITDWFGISAIASSCFHLRYFTFTENPVLQELSTPSMLRICSALFNGRRISVNDMKLNSLSEKSTFEVLQGFHSEFSKRAERNMPSPSCPAAFPVKALHSSSSHSSRKRVKTSSYTALKRGERESFKFPEKPKKLGVAVDIDAIKQNFGSMWLDRYRMMTTNTRMEPKEESPDCIFLPNETSEELINSSIRTQRPSWSRRELSAEETRRLLPRTLLAFLKRLCSTECGEWKLDGVQMFPSGLAMKCVEVNEEAKFQQLRNAPLHCMLSSAKQAYCGSGNVWQAPLPLLEIWLDDANAEVSTVKDCLGKYLIRVDTVCLECCAVYQVRIKEVSLETSTSHFSRPQFFSVHHKPWPQARTDSDTTVQLSNVHLSMHPSRGRDDGVVEMTRQKHQQYTSVFVGPTPPRVLCGFVVNTNAVMERVVDVILQTMRRCCSPNYFPQEFDWPVYTEVEKAVDVPLLEKRVSCGGGKRSDDSLLHVLWSQLETQDMQHTLLRQRVGSHFLVQPEDILPQLRSEWGACVLVGFIGALFVNAAFKDGNEQSYLMVVRNESILLVDDVKYVDATLPATDVPNVTHEFSVWDINEIAVGYGFCHAVLSLSSELRELTLWTREATNMLRLLQLLDYVVSCEFHLHGHDTTLQRGTPSDEPLETVRFYTQCFLSARPLENVTSPERSAATSKTSMSYRFSARSPTEQTLTSTVLRLYPVRLLPTAVEPWMRAVSVVVAKTEVRFFEGLDISSARSTETISVSLADVSLLEVAPRHAECARIAILHLGTRHNATREGCHSQRLLCFQHPLALDKFIAELSLACYEENSRELRKVPLRNVSDSDLVTVEALLDGRLAFST